MKNAIIFIIALAVSNLALAESHAQIYGKFSAPFGLEWGLSKEQVTAMGVKLTPADQAEGVYTAERLPKNLTDAKEYALLFKQGFGLVKALVGTHHITDDPYGSRGKRRYHQLKTAIVKKYGKPDFEDEWLLDNIAGYVIKVDDLFYDCVQNSACGQWKSRWGSKAHGYIGLAIRGVSRDTGFISLGYESAAFYVAEEQKAEEVIPSDEDAL